jgi:hypothetical protein
MINKKIQQQQKRDEELLNDEIVPATTIQREGHPKSHGPGSFYFPFSSSAIIGCR